MVLAGLYRHAHDKNDPDQYVTVTTASPEGSEMAKLHHRVPFILTDQQSMDKWLDVEHVHFLDKDKVSLLDRIQFKELTLTTAAAKEECKIPDVLNEPFLADTKSNSLKLIMWPVGKQVSSRD